MSDRTAVSSRSVASRSAATGRAAFANRYPLDIVSSMPWIAQWTLDRNYKDSIGSSHLTAVNSPTFGTGVLAGQGALQLVSASSQRAYAADSSLLSAGDTDYLVSVWANFDSLSANRTIVGKYETAGQLEWYIEYILAPNRIQFGWSANGTANAGLINWSSAPSTGVWYHILMWHDSTSGTLNARVNNGTPLSTAAVGGFDGTDLLYVGRVASGNYMGGRVRNFAIAKGAGAVPTALQCAALYNNGNGLDKLIK